MQLPVISQEQIDLKLKLLHITLPVLLFLSCALFQSDIDSVSDMLPRDTDLSGWTRIAPPEEYSGNRVKSYKTEYDKTGIERISICSYESFSYANSDDEKGTVTIEVMRFNGVQNSYGLFSRIAGENEFLAETENEFYGVNFAVALRGEYLVYVFTELNINNPVFDLKSFILPSLKNIGNSYSREKLNDRISILKYRDKNGIIFSGKSVEFLDGVDDIYYTVWRSEGAKIKVFFSERISFADSYRIFTEYIKKGYVIVESGSIHTAFKKESNGRYSFLSVSDKWLYGSLLSPDYKTGKRVTDELGARITDYAMR